MTLIIISSPSGGGKTTVCMMLLDPKTSSVSESLSFSISTTTRKKRPHEKNGREYYFVTRKQFEEQIANNDFLEYATIHGSLYGTNRKNISKTKHTLFDIDHQGYIQITEQNLPNTISLFLLPPSIHTLKKRLLERGDITTDEIHKRIAHSTVEIARSVDYQYIIPNVDIHKTCVIVHEIILSTLNQSESNVAKNVLIATEKIKNLSTDNIQQFLDEALKISQNVYYNS